MVQKAPKKILLTGASGFVGQQLIKQLNEEDQYLVRAAIRPSKRHYFQPNQDVIEISDISASTCWKDALQDCDLVIHAAARVHVMKETEEDPLNAFRQVNVFGTLNLARQAAEQGIKRFIYISSIKVNGEETKSSTFCADDLPAPEDPYGISKYEAEQALLKLSAETGMQVIIIRPPLVYGPGVGGNFQRMMMWLQKGYPLPFKLIKNRRSFVSVYNLVDLIVRCIDYSSQSNQIFLVSDGQDLSTAELLRLVAKSLNKPARLIPFPQWLLNTIATVLGKKAVAQRLCGSLRVDIHKTCELLDWKPVMTIDEAINKTTQDFIKI